MNFLSESVSTYHNSLKYSCTHKNGVRSSKRTDMLNEQAANMILKNLAKPDDWEVLKEEKIACARANHNQPNKKFTIDVLIKNKYTGKNIYVLLKSIESSYNKNSNNFANCVMGETQRIYGTGEIHGSTLKEQRKDDITLFLTYICKELPNGKKIEEVKYCTPSDNDLRIFSPHIHQVSVMLNNNLSHPSKESLLASINGKIVEERSAIKKFEEFLNDANK